ncbi:acetyl-CoA carboxylase family protein [Phaeobacter marinintestinus]|uniref:acetyl-CoA carboxylase family protein n=1 Tax=Falsiphaeobacter marinintestinus TaxID=1492905 RepID=UPI0011B3DF43|nr:carboxyl transferase domain-containing protein [Phaeobacter marinintestinus]
MTVQSLLIANRGEIAIRIAQAAADLGMRTVAVHTPDDADNLHVSLCDAAVALPKTGPRGYLDEQAIIDAALAQGCDAIHPGYGFLSETAGFAQRVEAAGLIFVGPTPETINHCGNKLSARTLAQDKEVPVVPGIGQITKAADAHAFLASLPDGAAMMIKAAAGGGGRGMRVVRDAADLDAALNACRAEALQAFGDDALYAERLIETARHIEVQVIGDGTGAVAHLGERECSLQRRHQKIIEIAPSPSLSQTTRDNLCAAALRMAQAVRYRGLGTFEFLVDQNSDEFFFIEVNPRLQVEHTVTEDLFGVDLVQTQLKIAGGATLSDLNLDQPKPAPTGYALQCRITLEDIDDTGIVRPSSGTVSHYEPPTGPGFRVDGFAYGGYRVHTGFDPLLAKLIVRSKAADYSAALRKADRGLARFRIDGVTTNMPFLRALVNDSQVQTNAVSTRWVEDHMQTLAQSQTNYRPAPTETAQDQNQPSEPPLADDEAAIRAPIQGTLSEITIAANDYIAPGQTIAILEAMKMEHLVTAQHTGQVLRLAAKVGDTLDQSGLIATILPEDTDHSEQTDEKVTDPDAIRPELGELRQRLSMGQDAARLTRVAKRKALGKSTARENLARLCDPDNFDEYGALALAAQRRRRDLSDLIANTTGDGIITGIGDVNADLFAPAQTRCALAIYDYLVLAGTQGVQNHAKQDRLFAVARDASLPVILFAEGGGGRPGDSDTGAISGLDVPTFATFATLADKVPLIGVASGRCFAGNAALLGCCDVIIATEDANIGMAGPAMIEGGGLGRFKPEDIGPIDVQTQNGVVDIRAKDEEAACDIAKKVLSYTQGDLNGWSIPDQANLRHAIPENRKRVHDVRQVIDGLADEGSVLELRADYGIGIRTAFIRVEGRAFGLMANNAMHLGGAIDGPAALKAARFMDLCNKYGLPILSLCDTPGFIVGPEAEETGLVRDVCQMFLSAAKLTVPVFGVVLRKGYGLGAMAMVGGGFHENAFTISWPTGEFGGMGLEGAVQLGFRKELDALTDPDEKQALFDKLVAKFYEHGKALSIGAVFEVDAVIDPADTRRWVVNGARSFKPQG